MGKIINSNVKPMYLLHADLFGHVNVLSLSRKKYALVIMDDFSRYTWVRCLTFKEETTKKIIDLIKTLDRISENKVVIIRSDNETEFRNSTLKDFCIEKGITHQFSAARTPYQNGIVEKKEHDFNISCKNHVV